MAVGLAQIEDILAQPFHRGDSLPTSLRIKTDAVRQFAAQVRGCPSVRRRAPVGAVWPGSVMRSGIERLFQEIERADPHRLDRDGHVAVAGNHDHGQAPNPIAIRRCSERRIPSMPGILMSEINDTPDNPRRLSRKRLFGAGIGFGVIAQTGPAIG